MSNLAIDLLPVARINRSSSMTILSSVTPYGKHTRIDSQYLVLPKMILAEMNTHRGMSKSDRSSRAVPPEILIQEIRSGLGLAMPAVFRGRTKGMGGGDEFTGDQLIEAQVAWIDDALYAADAAERAIRRGEEKETVNRRMDNYIYCHSLRTATRDIWLNFFGLRLDKGASRTIKRVADHAFNAYIYAKPQLLQPGEWHLPFLHSSDSSLPIMDPTSHLPEAALRLSAARSAHLSYHEVGKTEMMNLETACRIYNTLVHSKPLHASPQEHQAMVDIRYGEGPWQAAESPPMCYAHPEQSGNFCPGWRQYRKMLPGEAVAELPEEYQNYLNKEDIL